MRMLTIGIASLLLGFSAVGYAEETAKTIQPVDQSYCLRAVSQLNKWAEERGLNYTYKFKGNDLSELPQSNDEWCRVVAFKGAEEIGIVSYIRKDKQQRPHSQYDHYFNNHIEHPEVFPVAINGWCRGEGCENNAQY